MIRPAPNIGDEILSKLLFSISSPGHFPTFGCHMTDDKRQLTLKRIQSVGAVPFKYAWTIQSFTGLAPTPIMLMLCAFHTRFNDRELPKARVSGKTADDTRRIKTTADDLIRNRPTVDVADGLGVGLGLRRICSCVHFEE